MEVLTPVINYSRDSYGLRGINQIAEWGRIDGKVSAILGQMPADMIENEWVIEKEPSKYYTCTVSGRRKMRSSGFVFHTSGCFRKKPLEIIEVKCLNIPMPNA